MNNRIFTFGCSYTKWPWPTWADIIRLDTELEVYNLGIGGLGNVGIMHRMVECDLTHKFTDNDLILVVWSSWTREDRFSNDEWVALGNVFNNDVYDNNFIKKHWSFQNDIIKNSTAIISANKMFNINFQGHIMPIAEFESNSHLVKIEDKKYLDFYKPHISSDNVYENTLDEFNEVVQDEHPSILSHLNYVEKFIYPSLNFKLKTTTVDKVYTIHNDLINQLKKVKNKNMTFKNELIKQIVFEKHKIRYGKYI